MMELPPHTRRIHAYDCTCPTLNGTLCMCGEYTRPCRGRVARVELPPRTRRIRVIDALRYGCNGTTSAYAENTRPPGAWPLWAWNYLRVRGEYPISPTWVTKKEELPPRTRRILAGQGEPPAERGTTSAYAENTCRHVKLQRIIGNYLRVRGEYSRSDVATYR